MSVEFILCRQPSLHHDRCSGGEGHPHRDCYCGVFDDDTPLSPCPECKTPTLPTPTQGETR